MDYLQTEQRNEKTKGIDGLQTIDILTLINNEDRLVAEAVRKELPSIAQSVDAIVSRLNSGGRLIYIGAGTSGRLGVLDASECPPTFGVPPDLVQAIIAGGYEALYKAVESGEDFADKGASDLDARGITDKDAVVGIAASGRTPYTIGALKFARVKGALTIALTCNPGSLITKEAEISIAPATGAEAIAGSTRMKAGTAQKMVLNLLSTATMIRLGYVYDNLMSNLQSTNEKLRHRAASILSQESGLSIDASAELLNKAGNNLRVAMVMQKTGVDHSTAIDALTKNRNIIRATVEYIQKM